MDTKFCPRCSEDRPVGGFYRNKARPDGLSPLCVTHQRAATNESAWTKRAALISALGGACERCGFGDQRALQIDHINGEGAAERRGRRGGVAAFYAYVLANRSEFALLCANCNQIKKHTNGETVGKRVYVRQPPTKKLQGVGRGNGAGQRAALERARTSDAQAARGRKHAGQKRPAIAAARRGTKLVDGHWVHPG